MPRANRKIVDNITHVEVLHAHPFEAADFMRKMFSAVRTEVTFSEMASKMFEVEDIHMKMGNTVYQIVQAPESLADWHMQMEQLGHSIHNLCLQINGASELAQTLRDEGCIEQPGSGFSTPMRGGGFDSDEERALYMFDCREQCGLFIEFIERLPEWEPGETDTEPGSNKKVIDNLSLIKIIHPDPDKAADFLARVFGATEVEHAFSNLLGHVSQSRRIEMMMGGQVFQIAQPTPAFPEWAKAVEEFGPHMHQLTFQVNGADALAEKLRAAGCSEQPESGIEMNMGEAGFDTTETRKIYVFDLRPECGFSVEFLERLPEWEPGENL